MRLLYRCVHVTSSSLYINWLWFEQSGPTGMCGTLQVFVLRAVETALKPEAVTVLILVTQPLQLPVLEIAQRHKHAIMGHVQVFQKSEQLKQLNQCREI